MPDEGASVTTVARPKGAAKAGAGKAKRPLRFVTAASLFDGHDAAINVMRRILQAAGAEVIHLGHNRAVDELVTAAIQEDAHGIAVSSYQGGHIEFFKYMIDLLAQRGRPGIKVFGGGGGVIVASEIDELHAYGVARIYSPADGHHMGLDGMIEDMMARAEADLATDLPVAVDGLAGGDTAGLARVITGLESGRLGKASLGRIRDLAAARPGVPVIGITGTGGAGKSSLTDELIRRLRNHSG